MRQRASFTTIPFTEDLFYRWKSHRNFIGSIGQYDPAKWQKARENLRRRQWREKYPTPECPTWITFEHQVEYDDYQDISYLGKFTDRWEPGALEHSKSPREWRYFVPAYSFEERFKDYHSRGYSKQVAYELSQAGIRQDYSCVTNLETYWVLTKMFFHGEEVDSESLGGIDICHGEYSYLEEVKREHEEGLLRKYSWRITVPEYAYA